MRQYEEHETRKGRVSRTPKDKNDFFGGRESRVGRTFLETEQAQPEFGHSLGTIDGFEPSEALPKKLQ